MTKYHEPGGLSNANLLSHSPGDQKSKIKVLARLGSPKGCEGESDLCLSPHFWWPQATPWLWMAFSLHPHIIRLPFVCVPLGPNFPFL